MKKLTCGVYCITNKSNGKKYVGSSARAEYRFGQHKHAALSQKRLGCLYDDIREQGIKDFEFEILEECSRENLKEREEEWIFMVNAVHPRGYNKVSARGGYTKRILEAMPEGERQRCRELMRRVSKAGATAMSLLRKDPEFNRQYLEIRRAASYVREAKIRARRSESKEADEHYRLIRVVAAKTKYDADMADSERRAIRNAAREKARDTFRERMKDPEYAQMISEQRKKAAALSAAKRWGFKRPAECSDGLV